MLPQNDSSAAQAERRNFLSMKENRKKGWREFQDEIAEKHGLAVVLLDREGLEGVHRSNDNSICRHLNASEKFAPECMRFCGQVYRQISAEGKPLKYKCHAGLECIAVPVGVGTGEKKLVAITGRAFTKSNDYRRATERAISGDWSDFPPSKFFENILLTGASENIEHPAKRLMNLSTSEKELLENADEKSFADEKSSGEKSSQENPKEKSSEKKDSPAERKKLAEVIEEFNEQTEKHNDYIEKLRAEKSGEKKDLDEWRALFSSLLNLGYRKACRSILDFLEKRYEFSSTAWLESQENILSKMLARGELENESMQIKMPADDPRLLKAVRENSSIELREKREAKNASGDSETENQGKENYSSEPRTIRLFPIAVGENVRNALVIGDRIEDEKILKQIARFCRTVAPELEILRLREELAHRSWLGVALHKFNESLSLLDSDDFWARLMQTTAELMRAERGSLFVFDEKNNHLELKAAVGIKTGTIRQTGGEKIGERVIKKVWREGAPLVVPSIEKIGLKPAPSEWNYRTESFISFPVSIGARKIGILNLTDKIDDGIYDEFDLHLLDSIAPQVAVAIDRAYLKDRAGEFEQLSVTDALTGLLNRRYLEERLAEELIRTNRHGYSMSFMMIDVDNFKSYNDTYTHPEGDKALKLVARTLKDTLRGADVAARYGGEEFSILLPQTNLEEARVIAERIRKNIEDTEFPNRQVTISIGIAGASLELNTPEDLILAADKALFAAKNHGRNNVQIYETAGVEQGSF